MIFSQVHLWFYLSATRNITICSENLKLKFLTASLYWISLQRDHTEIYNNIGSKLLWYMIFNPFVPNAPFHYPLKISQNRKVF